MERRFLEAHEGFVPTVPLTLGGVVGTLHPLDDTESTPVCRDSTSEPITAVRSQATTNRPHSLHSSLLPLLSPLNGGYPCSLGEQ